MTQKLKPCPFCAGEAELIASNQPLSAGAFIMCKNCDAESGYTESANEAIAKWNTRHEPKREFVVNPSKQDYPQSPAATHHHKTSQTS